MIPAFRTPVSVIKQKAGSRDPMTGEYISGGNEVTRQTLGHLQPLKEGQSLTVTQTGQFYESQQVVVYLRGKVDLEVGTLIHADGSFYSVQGAQSWNLPRRQHTKLLCTLHTDQNVDVYIPPQAPM